MFTADTERQFIEGIVAALPLKDKGRMAPRVRALKGNAGLLADALLDEGAVIQPFAGFSRNETIALFEAAKGALESVTASTPVSTAPVKTGWSGNVGDLVVALNTIPEGLGARFATALETHDDPHAQVFILATGMSIPGKAPCPALKEALPRGKSRDAVLACMQKHVRGDVAEAK